MSERKVAVFTVPRCRNTENCILKEHIAHCSPLGPYYEADKWKEKKVTKK